MFLFMLVSIWFHSTWMFSKDLSRSQSVKFKALLQSRRSDVESCFGKALALAITGWHHQQLSLFFVMIIVIVIVVVALLLLLLIIIIIIIPPPPLDCIFMSWRLIPCIFWSNLSGGLCSSGEANWSGRATVWGAMCVCWIDRVHLDFDWRSTSPFIDDFMYALCWNVLRMSTAQVSINEIETSLIWHKLMVAFLSVCMFQQVLHHNLFWNLVVSGCFFRCFEQFRRPEFGGTLTSVLDIYINMLHSVPCMDLWCHDSNFIAFVLWSLIPQRCHLNKICLFSKSIPITPPKTNMSFENQWLEDVFYYFPIGICMGTCQFSGVVVVVVLVYWYLYTHRICCWLLRKHHLSGKKRPERPVRPEPKGESLEMSPKALVVGWVNVSSRKVTEMP